MHRVKALTVIALMMVFMAACAPQASPTAIPTSAPTIAAPTKGAAVSPTAVPATAAPTKGAAASNQKPIKIGVSVPLTGAMATVGQGYEWGAKLAAEDLGGQIAGRPIQIIMADDKATPTDAVTAIRRLIDDDQVDVILGPGASGPFLAAMPIAKESKIAILGVTASAATIFDQLGPAGGNEWAFRLNPDDLIIAKTLASYIAQEAKSVFIIGQNNDFGRSGAKAYQDVLPQVGVKVAGAEFYDDGTSDFRPILTKLKQSGADAIMTFMVEADSAPFFRQMKEVGIQVKVFTRGGVTSPLFLEMTKDDPKLAEGAIGASYWTQNLDPDTEKRFQARWNSPPTVHRMMAYYGTKLVIGDAISRAIAKNGELTRQGIRDALATVDLKNTPIGDIKFDSHNQAYPFLTLDTIKDGKITLMKTIQGQTR
jgi:branched-chain amino acid transport system substrate-binding protein